jgi:AraC-like DNA-binding protein
LHILSIGQESAKIDTEMMKKMEMVDLLTDLALATGYNAHIIDRNALLLASDEAAGIPHAEITCPDCALSSPPKCHVYWAALADEGLTHCPGERAYACLALRSEGALDGYLLLGPLHAAVASDERRTNALMTILRASAALMQRFGMLMRRNDLFANLSRYIVNHLNDELTGETLHRALYVSESTLFHIVKRETGMPLRLYIQAQRLEAARLLLLGTSMSVMQVAEKCGINDFNYFARIFKKRYGISPSALRKRSRMSAS